MSRLLLIDDKGTNRWIPNVGPFKLSVAQPKGNIMNTLSNLRLSDQPGQRTWGLGTLGRLGAVLLSVTLLTSACGGADDYNSADEAFDDVSHSLNEGSGGAEEAAEPMEDAGAMATTIVASGEVADSDAADVVTRTQTDSNSEPPTEGESAGEGSADVQAIERSIIRRANIHLQVDDVLASSAEAITLVRSYGGYVFGQETSTDDGARSSLTFKVPPEDFQSILDDLADIGFLRDQSVSAEDVTGRVVDMQSQIRTAETSVERLRTFLGEAKDLQTITDLEGSLLERETELEVLRGQLRTVQARVAEATIVVVLTQQVPGPALELEVTAYGGHDDGSTCVGQDELTIEDNADLTLCYRVTNTGDTFLTEISVRETELRLGEDDLKETIEGSLDFPLAPGEHVTFFTDVSAATHQSVLRGQVSATPSDELGNSLDIDKVSGRDELSLYVTADESIPTFGDGFSGSLAALVGLLKVLLVLAGAALPFIWVLPLGWFARREYLKRKSARLAARPKLQPFAAPAPAPAPAPAAPVSGTPPAPAPAPVQPVAPVQPSEPAQPDSPIE